MIVKQFGARAAGSGIAHGPKVFFQINDALVGNAQFIPPNLTRVVVSGMHRDEDFTGVQAHNIGSELPGPSNGFFFEVVTKTEVAHHLEKRVMTRGIAHIFKIVVFAAGANTTLGRSRARVPRIGLAKKRILELIHSCVRKQQRRIVIRHQGTRGYDAMAFGLVKVEESIT